MDSISIALLIAAEMLVLGFAFAWGYKYLAGAYFWMTGQIERMSLKHRFAGARIIRARVTGKRYSNGPASFRREPLLAVVLSDSEAIEGIVEEDLYFGVSEGDWVDLAVSCERRPHFVRSTQIEALRALS